MYWGWVGGCVQRVKGFPLPCDLSHDACRVTYHYFPSSIVDRMMDRRLGKPYLPTWIVWNCGCTYCTKTLMPLGTVVILSISISISVSVSVSVNAPYGSSHPGRM